MWSGVCVINPVLPFKFDIVCLHLHRFPRASSALTNGTWKCPPSSAATRSRTIQNSRKYNHNSIFQSPVTGPEGWERVWHLFMPCGVSKAHHGGDASLHNLNVLCLEDTLGLWCLTLVGAHHYDRALRSLLVELVSLRICGMPAHKHCRLF